MCKIKETNNKAMTENINDSFVACNKLLICKECVKAYKGVNDDKTFIPCNFIRKTYGVSIWDYKPKRR